MWKNKHRTLAYLGIGITSSVSAYIGVRNWFPVKELNAECITNKNTSEVRINLSMTRFLI